MPPLRCVLAAASERVEPGSTGRSTITSVVNGTQDVDFTSLVVTPRALAFTSILGDPAEEWATPAVGFGLAPGVYTLTLIGTNSASMGSDAGNLALTPGLPAAVPEPKITPCCLPVSGSSAFLRAATAPDRRRLDIEAGPARCSWARRRRTRRRRFSPAASPAAQPLGCRQEFTAHARRRLRPQPSSPTATIETKPGGSTVVNPMRRVALAARFASSRMS